MVRARTKGTRPEALDSLTGSQLLHQRRCGRAPAGGERRVHRREPATRHQQWQHARREQHFSKYYRQHHRQWHRLHALVHVPARTHERIGSRSSQRRWASLSRFASAYRAEPRDGGTSFPSRRASDKPIAMACLSPPRLPPFTLPRSRPILFSIIAPWGQKPTRSGTPTF